MTNPKDSAFGAASEEYLQKGLTKREYFAAMALQGFFADGTSESHLADYATRAVRAADFLINALNKQDNG